MKTRMKINPLPSIQPWDAVRFWEKVRKSKGCWIWKASRSVLGYGAFTLKGKQRQAHRVAWTIMYGTIPEGLLVCHRCDVRRCVRPDHLFLGTHRDNTRDMWDKGRARSHGRKLVAINDTNMREILRMSHEQRMGTIDISQAIGLSWESVDQVLYSSSWKFSAARENYKREKLVSAKLVSAEAARAAEIASHFSSTGTVGTGLEGLARIGSALGRESGRQDGRECTHLVQMGIWPEDADGASAE